jgi:hypothetical protein
MSYAHTNSQGETFYLHQRDVRLRGGRSLRVFFFAREVMDGAIDSLPLDRVVAEDPRSGLLRLKEGPSRTALDEIPSFEARDEDAIGIEFDRDGLQLTLLSAAATGLVEATDASLFKVTSRYFASTGIDGCIRELERLVQRDATSESELQACLERCPELLTIFGHDRAVPHVVLEASTGDLIPDFVLQPVEHDLCDLLELKLPTVPLLTGPERRPQASRRLARAIAQMQEYAEAIDDPQVRAKLETRYGLRTLRPRLFLVAGRSTALDGRIQGVTGRRSEPGTTSSRSPAIASCRPTTIVQIVQSYRAWRWPLSARGERALDRGPRVTAPYDIRMRR